MAAKRRRRGDTVDSPPKSADPAVESSTEFAKPVYLVAKLRARKPAYSLLTVDAAAGSGGTPSARNLGEFAGTRRGMSFVAAHSKHGSWIVGAGRGHIVIYDPITREAFAGPGLHMPKHKPVLISHGGKVYAMSRRPKVGIRAERDFVPWFECIDFNKGAPRIYKMDSCCWSALPPPPFFPGLMTPEEFRNPPEITVSSYAAVGPYILVSLQQEDKSTYGFHVVEKTWEKAVPLGGSLFAACRVASNNAGAAAAVSVFHMSIKASSIPEVSPELVTSVLTIQEFPVASEGEITWPVFCPLGKGSFCSIRKAARQNQEANDLVGLQIVLTAFQMDNIEATLKVEDLQAPVQLEQHNQTCELNAQHLCLDLPMPVVAALSMDNEHIEFFEEKTTQARETTTSNIFKPTFIRSMV
ncbi:unnamed protein product [Urochloa decumbens]|uniref:Uncharacterized protein n=1 Tax=Urochloa decumbens TaxID=240449 RepID=A0ABC9D2C2_9POAL